MDNKVLICLEVPSVDRIFEIWTPDDMAVKEMIPLFVRAVSELTDGLYISSGHEFLCAKIQHYLLDADAKLSDYNIGNGDHLLLL